MHNAAYLKSLRVPAGNINEKQMEDTIKSKCKKLYGDSLVLSYSNQQFFINQPYLKAHGLNYEQVCKEIVYHVMGLNGIASAYTAQEIKQAGSANDIVLHKIYNGYNDGLSGDVAVVYKPAFVEYGTTGTTHGAAYTYDTHVPLIWYGGSIRAGESFEPIYVCDIAPTIAAMLQISYPNGCVGKPIPALFNKQ